jgi:hypothetical protein
MSDSSAPFPTPREDPAKTSKTSNFQPKTLIFAAGGLLVIAIVACLWLRSTTNNPREALLSRMPSDAEAVLFLDLDQLRTAPFFSDLLTRSPKPVADAGYRQFVQDTGFDYERDLQQVAVAFEKQGSQSVLFAIADGHFDRDKIKAYAAKSGATHPVGDSEIFSQTVPEDGSRVLFKFLSKNRIALTNGPALEPLLSATKNSSGATADAWRTRFTRLAGSPVLAVIAHDGLQQATASDASTSPLAGRSTSGLTSSQLSTAIAQLQWVSIAAKPENGGLRLVAEGESLDEHQSKQLGDLLNQLVLIATLGLTTAHPPQIDATARDSYLALLKSIEISQINRSDTKSVRLMLLITPEVLKAAQLPMSSPAASPTPPPTPTKPAPNQR